MRKIIILLSIILMQMQQSNAQDTTATHHDLSIEMLNDKPGREYVEAAFKAPRVVMSHSIEMLKPGVLSFLILHRFGNINLGPSEFFGLDRATIRLGLDYGISKDLTVGLGRSSYKKEIDGFLKYRLLQQSKGVNAIPFSLVLVGGFTIETLKSTTVKMDFVSRLGYYGQLIIGRKFNEHLTLQLAPVIVHRNLVSVHTDPNDTYAVEVGGRFKLTKRISLNIDYCYVINKDKSLTVYDPLSIGFDIETGGHVFQLHLTNAIGMNERAFITETTNSWTKGDIQLGFNISRAFQVRKNKQLSY
jgi:hypothetical protein